MSTRVDITGKRSGKLVALRPVGKKDREIAWECSCDCGNTTVVRASVFSRQSIKSCGCLLAKIGESTRKHGLRRSPEYRAWAHMKTRCSLPSVERYNRYGGRGIKVCERWTVSFQDFYDDVGPRPSNKHTLDRIDVDGDYEPGNVRWATQEQQQNNRTSNHLLTVDGETKTLAEWCKITGVSYGKAWARSKRGKSPEDVIRADNL